VFRRLAEAMGRAELADDARYSTLSARGQHQVVLDELIAAWTSTLDAADVEATLIEHAVPTGKIYRAREMLDDPHFAARDAIVRLPHPTFGEFPMQNVMPKLSDTPGAVRWVGPELGQHNDEVYGELLSLTAEERAALAADGVI
jgi:formyl-CoA transferase